MRWWLVGLLLLTGCVGDAEDASVIPARQPCACDEKIQAVLCEFGMPNWHAQSQEGDGFGDTLIYGDRMYIFVSSGDSCYTGYSGP